ncbi:gluconate kinase [Alkalicella caledoniensis]|uniref:Gluconate kinase n=1 Tax=Alkalicella caledoniensis TaxID=2731377 RepID=A0A7G9W6B2_ALKCA|nr:FGGY family carbohydrate kinase [Alkalicella caledoniensis]QNO14224.1 gluconate kinase [Alkalicella caledoniensis]
MPQYYIGIDIGTTSTKSIVFNKDGHIISKASREYPIISTMPSFREQDPEEILEAVIHTLKESIRVGNINPNDISFVSFSSMMHSVIAVDKEGKPLTNCIIWADNRSVTYAEEFKKNGQGLEIYKRTGTPTHPMSPLYKLMWLRDNQPEIYKNAYKFISIKEYVFYSFFGDYIVDYSIASATGMFNIFDLKWDKEVLGLLGINETKLSKTVSTTYSLKNINGELCSQTGLNQNTTFVVGASDGCLANLGSNAIQKGVAAATIGTSGAVRVAFDQPVTDPEGRVFCYVLTEDKYIVGGPINNGGIIYRWFRDNFGELEVKRAMEMDSDSYSLLNEYIDNTQPGSNGLVFLPFLAGERAPYWNANLRGAYIGISDAHKKEHFTRALIEGICYDMNDILEAVKELVVEVESIYANGGFTRSEEWVQTLCDVMDTKVIVHENYESPCLGAVMLGMLATGLVEHLEECQDMVKDFNVYNVRKENALLYQRLFKIYKKAIANLTPLLESLAEFQNK